MIASLPMYDLPQVMAANDRLWAALRGALRGAGLAAPDALTRGADDLWPQWTDPGLTFSQTCGYPYRSRLHGQVTLIGTPDYGVEGCPPGHYRSVLVVRADDPRGALGDFDGAPFAYNEALSQSGWAAPQNHAAALGLRLPPALRTGGHLLSARAVAGGHADIAALDAVSWRLFRAAGAAPGLRVIDVTPPTPGLPFIAGPGRDAALLFRLTAAAIAAMPAADRDVTGLRGLVSIPPESYLAVPNPPAPDQIGRSN